ncbi:chromate transporter [Ruminococcus gauvreauii]|uniref:Chromate transporter n=1 Tax=Ruminococcus gauvreauii TaxID=438033 RepID=A0ABY5VH21_9FIRM|nr:chromate transporter [Ruminococcus gauvreauii]UWP59318.1 chromate transporter [Ruminococcus gauvreauii]
MIYIKLFLSFLQIGMFSFGGGYAAMPLIKEQVVNVHSWMTLGEFTDLITISQMTPGPIAINSATFVGLKIAGIAGAVIATVGCILPSCILVLALARIYLRYRKMNMLQGILDSLRPAVVAMIASAGISILLSAFFGSEAVKPGNIRLDAVIIFILAVVLLKVKNKNPILVMVMCGVMEVLYSVVKGVIV